MAVNRYIIFPSLKGFILYHYNLTDHSKLDFQTKENEFPQLDGSSVFSTIL